MVDEHRIHAFIRGRVQGVYFRLTTQEKAQSLKLSGWVRNLPDGRVECEAQGPEQALADFTAYLHQGPTRARVDAVTFEDVSSEGPLPSPFEVLR